MKQTVCDDDFHDDATRCTDNTDESVASNCPTNIAAARHAACNAQQPHKFIIKEDPVKLEKRRQSNRLSAQRWRMRKRSKISGLQGQIEALKKEQEELEVERSELQAELRVQLTLAEGEMKSTIATARMASVQRAQRVNEYLRLDAELNWMSRMSATGHLLGALPSLPHICAKAQSEQVPRCRFQPGGPTWPSYLLSAPLVSDHFSHDGFMAMLGTVAVPPFTKLDDGV